MDDQNEINYKMAYEIEKAKFEMEFKSSEFWKLMYAELRDQVQKLEEELENCKRYTIRPYNQE